MALTISAVMVEDVGSDKKSEPKPIVYFSERDKGLVLNVTNKNTLVELLGVETDRWKGQRITLFPTQVDFRGDQVEAIRIRLRQPGQDAAAVPTVPAPTTTANIKSAWTAYNAACKGEPPDVITNSWKSLLTAWFKGRPKETITSANWQSLIDAKFKMPPPATMDFLPESGEIPESEIPF